MATKSPALAKLTPPMLPVVLARPRLFRLLDQARKQPVIWIGAPPGYGKTTLVAGYLQARNRRVLWYQVDEQDGDPTTFFHYLSLAIKKAAPRDRKPLPRLMPEYALGLLTFARRFFESLYERLTPPAAIVFDGYQRVPRDAPLHELVQVGLCEIPHGVSVFVISRNMPPPAFARLQVGQSVAMIGEEALRLTAEESRDIVRLHARSQGWKLSDELLEHLHGKARGWVGGLILLSEQVRTVIMGLRPTPHHENAGGAELGAQACAAGVPTPGRVGSGILPADSRPLVDRGPGTAPMRAPEGFLTPGLLGDRTRMFKAAQESSSLLSPETPEAVFDYFSKEIMEGLDAETQTFLVKTAVLPTITIAMAEQLTGLSSAHDILTRLCQSHCFAEQCHGGDPVYRYHPLFREFLLARRRQVLSPRELADVQRTAARLLEETGRTEEAFALFLQAGQVKDAIELILNHAPVLLAQGRAPTVERWLRVLPPAQLGTTPWLPFWFGSCRLYFDAVESEGLFERAFGGFEAQGDQAGKLLAACGLVESQLLSGADFRRLDPWIDRLPELLNEAASVLTPDIEARAVCAIFTAMLWRRPQYGAIAEWAARAYVLAQSPANVRHTPLIGTNLVLYYLFMGDHAKVERLLDLLRESSRSPEAPPPATIALFLAEAADAWQTGDQARCFKAVHQCLDTAKASGIVVFNAVALEAGICGALLTGDVPTAEALLREVPPTWDHSVSFKGHYYLLLAWIAMLRGHLHIAWRQIETAMSLATERYGTCLEALCHLMAAQVLHECGDKPKAAQHLACAKTIVQDLRSRHLEYVCLLTEAQFALDRGDETTGCRLLHAAMTLGRERGLVHYLGWNPSVMARLCVKALEAGIEVDYVRHLVRTGRLMPDQPPFAVESWPWPLKLTTLGPLTLTVDGEPVRFSNKVQRRPLDLLKALVAFGGYDVPVTKMLDALWPELDGDAAQRAFKITLHRLRRLVRQKDSIKLHGSRISLKPQTWYVDVWAFESLLREAEVTWSRGQKDRCAAARDRALMLYHGPFLTGDSDPWAEPVRRNLRAAFSEAILKAAEEWDAQGDPAHAAACLEQGMTLDPLAKPLYPALVKGLSRLGRRWQAHEVYRRCRLTAAECVCCCPCQEMEEALHALMTAGSSGAPPSESHA